MTESARRLGRLGLFVVMAGVSWLVEACGGNTGEPEHPSGAGGAGTGGASNSGGTVTSQTGGNGAGGAPVIVGTGGGTNATGGSAGLYDLPCE